MFAAEHDGASAQTVGWRHQYRLLSLLCCRRESRTETKLIMKGKLIFCYTWIFPFSTKKKNQIIDLRSHNWNCVKKVQFVCTPIRILLMRCDWNWAWWSLFPAKQGHIGTLCLHQVIASSVNVLYVSGTNLDHIKPAIKGNRAFGCTRVFAFSIKKN